MNFEELREAAAVSLLSKITDGAVNPGDLIKILSLDDTGHTQQDNSFASFVLKLADD